ncbi:MAG: hypothetical protein KatS3mg008_0761 [Acidimicrobiales bacterium]|nr:MAG: hypothetical protein KatS3mg008_0761 [Acidimicrobiales bacterium]
MDFELPPDDHPTRREIRRWLEEHPSPTGRQLAEAGLVAPHWPRPWGWDADPVTQLVIEDELARAGVRLPSNPIGIGWAGPTILYAGTDEQKRRYLLPLLAGEEIWCQLFSEPEAGSDLANLATRARRDGDEYVVTGRKVWTSLAHVAKFGILLARTDPDVPKREGISYFICPMDAEGIEVRPIIEMTGVPRFQRGDTRGGPDTCREPGRQRERGLDVGTGHARERASVAVDWWRLVGHGAHGRGSGARSRGTRRTGRSGLATATRSGVDGVAGCSGCCS